VSYTFSIPCLKPPLVRAILDAVGAVVASVAGRIERFRDRPWPESEIFHFFRKGISARPVEVTLETGTFDVRVLTLSAPEDYELALRFAEAFARAGRMRVHPEFGSPLRVLELRKAHGDDWIRATNAGGAEALVASVLEEGDTATLEGVVRPFHVGPRVVSELGLDGGPEEFASRLVERLRASQWIAGEESDVFAANAFVAKNDHGEPVTFAAWVPACRCLFPDVPYLRLASSPSSRPGAPFFIPTEALEKIEGVRWTWLDEKQRIVEPIEDWTEHLARARRFAVSLGGKAKPPAERAKPPAKRVKPSAKKAKPSAKKAKPKRK
jgi:hypothetical protein